MATDQQIANEMGDFLKARGYECGQRYTALGGVVRSIQGRFADETEASLQAKAERIVNIRAYGFKTRTGTEGTEVSASSSKPECGN